MSRSLIHQSPTANLILGRIPALRDRSFERGCQARYICPPVPEFIIAIRLRPTAAFTGVCQAIQAIITGIIQGCVPCRSGPSSNRLSRNISVVVPRSVTVPQVQGIGPGIATISRHANSQPYRHRLQSVIEALLGSLSDDELEATYDHVLKQFARSF